MSTFGFWKNRSTRLNDASPKPVLRRLLPSLAVMVLLLIVGAGALLYQQYQQQMTREIAAVIFHVSGDLRRALDLQTYSLSVAANPIATNANAQKALREGDADRLLADWRPVFEALHRENYLTHFYFFDKTRVCLLRVHKPEKRGDRIERFTALEAERTGKSAFGLELGPLGTFTLRVVKPVFESGRLVGYVELGKEIEEVLQTINTQSGTQLAVVIRKEHLNRQTWEEGMRLLGREADWDRLPRSVVIYASQGHLPDAFASWADHFADDHVHHETDRDIALDGKDWRVSATPMRDASGKGVGDLLVMRDISANKAAFTRLLTLGGTGGAVLLALLLGFIYVLLHRTDADIRIQQVVLRESEEKYRSLIESLPIGLYRNTPGPQGRFIMVNTALARLHGFDSVEEFFSRNVLDLYVDPAQRMEISADLVEKGFVSNKEVMLKRKDGTSIWGSITARAIRDYEGKVVYFDGTVTDITELKRTEQTQLRLVAMLNATSGFVGFADAKDTHILYINPAGRKMVGVQAQEDVTQLKIADVHPEWTNKLLRDEIIPTAIRDGMWTGECAFLNRDGHEISVMMTLLAHKSPSGEMEQFSTISIDITERLRAEEEKRRLEEQLQRAEKMESLGLLAGGVAHDLNNVLGIVVGYAELLLMDAEKSSSIRPSLAHILDGGQRAAAIIQDLLALARRGVSGRQVLNLNKITVDCRNSPEFEKLSSYHASVKIKTDLEPELLNISGSAVHLGKTLFNLVSNASEAMPRGGTLTIKTANQYLDRPIQGYDEVREGDYVVLSVSDSGEGVPAADLKRIFEPFYTKKVMGRSGTGLGLAVVWGTVKDHQGYINVQSEEGKGSTFTLYFPVAREEITAEEVALSISEYLGKGEAILVVDDVQGQRELAAMMLRKLNYRVTSVESGEEAVATLKEHKVDLMVLDMIMDPGMDGLDTYKSILEIHPRQKAIIVSGFSETERVNAAQALGAGAYVRKPYIIEKLGLAVRKELDRG